MKTGKIWITIAITELVLVVVAIVAIAFKEHETFQNVLIIWLFIDKVSTGFIKQKYDEAMGANSQDHE